mgnify:CR=1 FL=1
MKRDAIISFGQYTVNTVLNSYSMLFFSNRKFFAAIVLLTSFFNPYTGFAGFVATLIAALAAWFIGFSREQVKTGLYTYSGLLVGLGMGTFYEFSLGFWILLALSAIFSVMLSAALIAKLGKSNLPALSLAFIFTLWLVILSSREFAVIGLTERNIYWLNEMYATGGADLVRLVQWFEELPLPDSVAGFLRSLSAILFQSNIAAGIVLTIGLFLFSRIALTLMVAGYTIAILFIQLMDGYAGGVNYYNLGTNFMLVSVALGGFYIIPSVRSYFWSLITVPISYILVIAFWKITYSWGLPVFSLPFCFTVILFIYVLQLRKAGGKMVLTPVQYYSPEENLYRYINSRERVYNSFYYYHLGLPFMGDWTVSQGYNGGITHKGDWSKALDFVIKDKDGKTYYGDGSMPEQYYCYNKPVLSPMDGTVEEVIDHVEDNPIGKNNLHHNWGNTIVIKHADGLYTKLSHLKKGSFRVAKGAYVRKGDIVASCGSSGRSPEPHLHFQVQATPYFDSKTLEYPFAYYILTAGNQASVETFSVPQERSVISNVALNNQMKAAFTFQPGYCMKVKAAGFKNEEWEVMVSAYNETYFYSKQSNAYAYFVNNGTVFYFTNYFGSRHSLLYLFYKAAYKIVLTADKRIVTKDIYPQNILAWHPLKWMQDIFSPFAIFMKTSYNSAVKQDGDVIGGGTIVLNNAAEQKVLYRKKQVFESEIRIRDGRIFAFTATLRNQKIEIICGN